MASDNTRKGFPSLRVRYINGNDRSDVDSLESPPTIRCVQAPGSVIQVSAHSSPPTPTNGQLKRQRKFEVEMEHRLERHRKHYWKNITRQCARTDSSSGVVARNDADSSHDGNFPNLAEKAIKPILDQGICRRPQAVACEVQHPVSPPQPHGRGNRPSFRPQAQAPMARGEPAGRYSNFAPRPRRTIELEEVIWRVPGSVADPVDASNTVSVATRLSPSVPSPEGPVSSNPLSRRHLEQDHINLGQLPKVKRAKAKKSKAQKDQTKGDVAKKDDAEDVETIKEDLEWEAEDMERIEEDLEWDLVHDGRPSAPNGEKGQVKAKGWFGGWL